eukprot:TRINITY_DN48007_c0_g1_i1.p1 TRINITY_DN48007_c0_g1~~TRINITY_DN48007_c0_g1_i1.p1  ORF type:complete len:241 (+),score=56.32 TRINITY_DN48007_c0_g1_i1:100-723(+)
MAGRPPSRVPVSDDGITVGSLVEIRDELCEANGVRGKVVAVAIDGQSAEVALPITGNISIPVRSLQVLRGTQKVGGTTRWLGDNKFDCQIGPEGHSLIIEPGPGGEHQAPMQALIAASASCAGSGVVSKIEAAGYHLDDMEIKCSANRIPGSVFETLNLHFVVTSQDVPEAWLSEVVGMHRCSVNDSVAGVTRVTMTGEVRQTGKLG